MHSMQLRIAQHDRVDRADADHSRVGDCWPDVSRRA
jgi:hypothetical protein